MLACSATRLDKGQAALGGSCEDTGHGSHVGRTDVKAVRAAACPAAERKAMMRPHLWHSPGWTVVGMLVGLGGSRRVLQTRPGEGC